MTKATLADNMAERLKISKKEASAHLEELLELIKTTLESGEQVKIAGFGVFQIQQKKNRRGRNPQTGEAITIGARKVMSFKVSNVLKEAINREA
ncbi:MAG: integration host factor subunit alpha [Desulfuromonadaceae bacterium]|nr:integration host factor subunit alpha [Desulfuromonadaceae bacterium]